MALEIYMLGVIVEDMPRAVEFYRRLGLALPEGAENKEHVRVGMGGMTFFLNTERRHVTPVDPNWTRGTGGYRTIIEFNLGTREAVDAKYAEMISHGYRSYRAPYDATPAALHFAMIDDPDGNTILLSAV